MVGNDYNMPREDRLDHNSLLYWFPKIQNLGIPYPKTEIVLFSEGYESLFDYLEGKSLSQKLIEELEVRATKLGFPLFMRTDQLSGKHSYHEWLPYVENKESFPHKILDLMETSINAGIFGISLNAFILREFLELDYKFKAFGGMPIAKERRYFIENKKVKCHHQYWIEEAIKFWRDVKEPKNWKEQLERLNTETRDEIKILTEYSLKVASVLDGYWSVDYAHAKNGTWYLIDCAKGEESWHPPCKYKLTDDIEGS